MGETEYVHADSTGEVQVSAATPADRAADCVTVEASAGLRFVFSTTSDEPGVGYMIEGGCLHVLVQGRDRVLRVFSPSGWLWVEEGSAAYRTKRSRMTVS